MLNTVLFDMGGTLEDVRYSDETIRRVTEELMCRLRAHGLEPGCTPAEFWERVDAGVKRYKRWSEPAMLEKKPEEIWPDYYLGAFDFPREVLVPIAEELGDLWERTYYHRELRPGVKALLDALRLRGYRLGVVSNNASLYNVFNVLEEYGIRPYMEDVTVSSVVGYRKPHQEIFNIALRQMQVTAGECVYVGDTISRDIIGAKRAGFGRAVQIASFLATKKDINLPPDAEKPDVVIADFQELLDWLDGENPAMALHNLPAGEGKKAVIAQI